MATLLDADRVRTIVDAFGQKPRAEVVNQINKAFADDLLLQKLPGLINKHEYITPAEVTDVFKLLVTGGYPSELDGKEFGDWKPEHQAYIARVLMNWVEASRDGSERADYTLVALGDFIVNTEIEK